MACALCVRRFGTHGSAPLHTIWRASGGHAFGGWPGAGVGNREPPERGCLPVRLHCGHVWTSLGTPAHELFEIPEYFESDRRLVYCGSFGVHVSAPRAVENFLDLAHFPFVHQGVLGAEPHTEVKDYDVAVSGDFREVIAKRCR